LTFGFVSAQSQVTTILLPHRHIISVNALTGPAYMQFAVIASTNLSLPRSNWTRISTNVLSQFGDGTLVLPMEPDKPRRFYSLTLPP